MDKKGEADRSGWHDPRHWRGGWLGLYVNPADARLWVPKKRPGLGWTLNLGHRRAPLALGALALGIAVAVALAMVFDQK